SVAEAAPLTAQAVLPAHRCLRPGPFPADVSRPVVDAWAMVPHCAVLIDWRRNARTARMPVLFLDCLTGMIGLWERVLRPQDPPIKVNIADGQPEGLPTLLDGFDICINDHTFFDADLLARCADLRHIVFLG